MMTLQAMFNKAYLGIAKQGFMQANNPERMNGLGKPSCQYLTPDGKRCAVGHLMTNPAALPADVQGNSISDPFIVEAVASSIGRLKSEPFPHMFLGDLQSAHDRGETPEMMRENLAAFAKLYDLTIPELPEEEATPIPVEPSFENLMAPVLSTREATPSPA